MLQFAHPWVLGTLPVLGLLFWLLARFDERTTRLRRIASFAVRLLAVAALTGAMASPSMSTSAPRAPLVVFAIDISESVDDAALEDALLTIARTPGRVGVVAFAGRAEVLRPADPGFAITDELRTRILARRHVAELRLKAEQSEQAAEAFGRLATWHASLDPMHTDIAEAVAVAQSLYRADCENRTIVLTDGRAALIPDEPRVRYAALPAPRRKDFIVRALHAPAAVRYGEPFDVRVQVESTFETEWTIALTIDEQPSRVEKFHMRPGRATVSLRNLQKDRPLDAGLHRLRVNVAAPGDEESRNNVAYGSVTVVGKLRVLLVDGAPREGDGLAQILTLQAIEHQRVAADKFSAWRDDLRGFTAIVFAGVSPGSLTAGDFDALRAYVANGGGLLVTGASRLEADKTLTRAELARLLPVEFAPPKEMPGPGPDPKPTPSTNGGGTAETKKVLSPSIALCLMIDRSGSMAGTPLTLAKEACIAAAKALTDKDYVAVVAFDTKPWTILEFTRADQSKEIEEKILRVTADGGTKIHAGLEEALKLYTLSRVSESAIKHCILLSDGLTQPSDIAPLLAEFKSFGVTVSTVCVGVEEFDFQLMHAIARECGGRARFTNSYKHVPQLFVEEAKEIVKKADRKAPDEQPKMKPPDPKPDPEPKPVPTKRTIAVVARDEHEVLRGLERDFKALEGALNGKLRAGAIQPLVSKDGDPVLAIHRYDLGKVAVWMSDVGGPWSAGWNEWAGTPKLFAQIVRHLSSAAEDLDLATRLRVDAREIRIDGDAELHQLAPTRRRIDLRPAGDGAFVASIPAETPGTPVDLAVTRVRKDGTTETLPLSVATPYDPEIASAADAPSSLDRVDARPLDELARLLPSDTRAPERAPVAIWFVLAALVLLPIDVALRRISL